MKTFLKALVVGTTPALVATGVLGTDHPVARIVPLDDPSSKPSTQPSPTPPVQITAGIRG